MALLKKTSERSDLIVVGAGPLRRGVPPLNRQLSAHFS